MSVAAPDIQNRMNELDVAHEFAFDRPQKSPVGRHAFQMRRQKIPLCGVAHAARRFSCRRRSKSASYASTVTPGS